MSSPRILVAGIGNIFHGDDAFGSVVARTLAREAMPAGVVVMDVGIRGVHLVYTLMEGWDAVILVDAMRRGGPPGKIYVLAPDLPTPEDAASPVEAHSMDPVRVLAHARAAGAELGVVRIVGCEPETLSADGIALSPAVEAAILPACRAVRSVISDFPQAHRDSPKADGVHA